MSSDCGVVRDADGLQLASETLGDLAKLADDLPARSIASYEVIDLLRVSRAIVASADGAHRVARLAHAPRIPEPVRRVPRPVRLPRRGGARVRRAAGRRRAGSVMTAFDPPRAVVRRLVEDALAEDLGILGDITSLACVDEDQHAEAVFVARDDGVLAGTALATETFRQLDEQIDVRVERARRRLGRGRDASRSGVRPVAHDPHRRAHRAQLPVSLLRHRDDDAPLRHGRARQGARARHAQDASRACARSSGRRCAPAAGSTTATRSATRC